MQFNEYQELAGRTAKHLPFEEDLIHAALGLTSEAGEFASAVKSHVVYDKELDIVNCIEEIGDILWFAARAASSLGVSLDDIAEQNINKLRKRYGEKYSNQAAQERADKQ